MHVIIILPMFLLYLVDDVTNRTHGRTKVENGGIRYEIGQFIGQYSKVMSFEVCGECVHGLDWRASLT